MPTNLKNIGLEESEARVYEALLALGPATVSEITAKANITRTLGYDVLERLALHGLVDRVSGAGAKIKYSANHPRSLLQYVKNRENQWARRSKEAERLLPELVSLYKIAEKPTIRYQEGVLGIKNIFSETLEAKGEIFSILDIEGWNSEELRAWGKGYNRERSARKIHERILFLDTPSGREWMHHYRGSKKYTDFRWIKPSDLPGILEFGGEINIYDNRVALALLQQPNRMGVLIESQALANILKGLFEMAWRYSKPIRK
ncbi:MAG: helix-turn-helix domain-containing protein [Candidatus Magasanikbacteria bacterium]|nr:helix-turn-helix domain-containing protein [Candidatus Magasanikbacteria bacterium]